MYTNTCAQLNIYRKVFVCFQLPVHATQLPTNTNTNTHPHTHTNAHITTQHTHTHIYTCNPIAAHENLYKVIRFKEYKFCLFCAKHTQTFLCLHLHLNPPEHPPTQRHTHSPPNVIFANQLTSFSSSTTPLLTPSLELRIKLIKIFFNMTW